MEKPHARGRAGRDDGRSTGPYASGKRDARGQRRSRERATKVTLRFSEPTRLTALTIQKEGEKAAERIQGLPKEPSKELSAPLAPLGAGKYTLDWRALGADNHVMSGKLRFTVAAR